MLIYMIYSYLVSHICKYLYYVCLHILINIIITLFTRRMFYLQPIYYNNNDNSTYTICDYIVYILQHIAK